MTTFFLYPNKGLVQNGTGPGLSVDNTPVNRGSVAAAACRNDNTTLPKACNVTVTGPAASGQNYYVRITSLYSNADLVLSSVNPGIGFSGAQALIDSTGKAQDVLRRIQVRRSLNDDQGIPDYSLQVAAGLCKRYMVAPGTPTPVAIDPGVTNPNDIAGICALN